MFRVSSRILVTTLVAAWLPLAALPAEAHPTSSVLAAPAPACAGVIVGSLKPTDQTLTASCTFIYTGGPLAFAAVAFEVMPPECPAFPLACTWVTIRTDKQGRCGGSGGCVATNLESQRGIRRFQTVTCTASVEPAWGPQIILGAVFSCGNYGVVALHPQFRPRRFICDRVGCLTGRRPIE